MSAEVEHTILLVVAKMAPCGPIEVLATAERDHGVDRRSGRDAMNRLIESAELEVGWDRKLRLGHSDTDVLP